MKYVYIIFEMFIFYYSLWKKYISEILTLLLKHYFEFHVFNTCMNNNE